MQKLVRDGYKDIDSMDTYSAKDSDISFKFHFLKEKLKEEVTELIESEFLDLAEYADVFTVLNKIMEEYDVDPNMIDQAMIMKANNRGLFDEFLIWNDGRDLVQCETGTDEPDELPDESVNNGGSTDYYKLPSGAIDLQDLIEAKGMNFAQGNIFKAMYRSGVDHHSSYERDLNKIIYFAERELKRLKGQR